jgi:hypothetical protein
VKWRPKTGNVWDYKWPGRHRKVYACIHVFDGERPALDVTRADGEWSVLCGELHPDEATSYRVVGIGHLVDRDARLAEVLDLEPEEEAERSDAHSLWVRSQVPNA